MTAEPDWICPGTYALVLLPAGYRLRTSDLPEGTVVASIRVSPNTFERVPAAWEHLATQLGRYLRERAQAGAKA